MNNANASEVRVLLSGLAAVAFDFDGVLADSVGVKRDAFLDLYPTESDEYREEVARHHHEHGGISRYDKIAHYERIRTGVAPSSSQVGLLAAEFARAVKQRVISAEEMPGASKLLEQLSQTLPLFVCSGTPEIELRDIVSARNWSGYFQGVFGSPAKKPAMLREIAAGLGCSCDDMLLIGDSNTDWDAAQESGSRFLLVAPDREADPPRGYRGLFVRSPDEILRLL